MTIPEAQSAVDKFNSRFRVGRAVTASVMIDGRLTRIRTTTASMAYRDGTRALVLVAGNVGGVCIVEGITT